jgi:glutathione S-transferase
MTMTNPTQPQITLYAGGPQFGLPEVSPYVTKAEVQLQIAGLAYTKVPGSREASPKGQLPYADIDGRMIADSHFIRLTIEQEFGIDLDAGLDARDRGHAWAIERMLENHFGWICGQARFMIPANFAKGPARWFDQAPEAVRDQLRADLQQAVADRIYAVGISRHNEEEVLNLATRTLDALRDQLGDKAYLMADHATSVDAIAFAVLASTLTPFFDSPLRRLIESYPTLVAYEHRMMAQFYPDHAAQLQAA